MNTVREVFQQTIAGFLAVLLVVHVFSFWRSQIRKGGDRKIRKIGTKREAGASRNAPVDPR